MDEDIKFMKEASGYHGVIYKKIFVCGNLTRPDGNTVQISGCGCRLNPQHTCPEHAWILDNPGKPPEKNPFINKENHDRKTK